MTVDSDSVILKTKILSHSFQLTEISITLLFLF